MADNYRLTNKTLMGVTSAGSNSARLQASEAERKAAEALAKAEEALKTISEVIKSTELLDQIADLSEKLNAEIARSIAQDNTHTETIKQLETPFEFIDSGEINIWPEEEND